MITTLLIILGALFAAVIGRTILDPWPSPPPWMPKVRPTRNARCRRWMRLPCPHSDPPRCVAPAGHYAGEHRRGASTEVAAGAGQCARSTRHPLPAWRATGIEANPKSDVATVVSDRLVFGPQFAPEA